MTTLPDGPQVTVTVTKHLSMELNADEIEAVILEWAKTRGFSHRAQVTLDAYRVTVTETIPE